MTDPGRDIVEGIDARATKAKFKATWRDGNEKKMEKEASGEIAKYSREKRKKNMNRSTRRRLKREILKMHSPTLDCKFTESENF